MKLPERKANRLKNYDYSSDEKGNQKLWDYIDSNPVKWRDDCFYIPD